MLLFLKFAIIFNELARKPSGSLPHRQLRKFLFPIGWFAVGSLPHRQLRKLPALRSRSGKRSLPHRQLRK